MLFSTLHVHNKSSLSLSCKQLLYGLIIPNSDTNGRILPRFCNLVVINCTLEIFHNEEKRTKIFKTRWRKYHLWQIIHGMFPYLRWCRPHIENEWVKILSWKQNKVQSKNFPKLQEDFMKIGILIIFRKVQLL